ncbi:MAG TPA: hypothetical protein VMG62_04780 [Solirubrobacteraceae bacterium]|nr:hypothetical protein [Solirubrobacteraceae bacterium]
MLLSLCSLALALVLLAPSALGGSPAKPHAHAAGHYVITGLGDEQGEMFSNRLWQQLHTKIVRYIAPYDAAVRPASLAKARAWIYAAKAQHQQVLVAFYHSEYTPTKMPSFTVYQRDVQRFVKLFPGVRQYQSWDEANRGNVPHYFSSPSAVAAAKYYQALKRVCGGCTVIGLDVLDQDNISPTLRYIGEFKREVVALHTPMPSIWGLHNYSDINRLESWRTRELARALGGQVWLTETGGIVQFGGAFPNRHGSGLTRAAKVLKYMFAVAGAIPQIKRLYIYDWTGGVTSTRFDAGLMNAHDQPRAGYVVVCKALRGTRCGGFKLARN